ICDRREITASASNRFDFPALLAPRTIRSGSKFSPKSWKDLNPLISTRVITNKILHEDPACTNAEAGRGVVTHLAGGHPRRHHGLDEVQPRRRAARQLGFA